jgi:hypothetical protein
VSGGSPDLRLLRPDLRFLREQEIQKISPSNDYIVAPTGGQSRSDW